MSSGVGDNSSTFSDDDISKKVESSTLTQIGDKISELSGIGDSSSTIGEEAIKDVESSTPSGTGDNEGENTDGEEDEGDEAHSNKTKLIDDFVDEEALKAQEIDLTEDQLKERLSKSQELKNEGNEEFRAGRFRESIYKYTEALLVCPMKDEMRAFLYSNRSAAKLRLEMKELAIEDCSLALKHNPKFPKVLQRRAKLYEEEDKLDEALADYTAFLELEPDNAEARAAVHFLPGRIAERNEKLKTEVFGKLKDLGNLVLRPFGLSTDNFALEESEGGGYSINFKK